MAENIGNNVQTTLSTAVTLTDEVITVGATGSFPEAVFRILIDAELMLVIATESATTFRVRRGMENTTVATHAIGAAVTSVVTAEGLRQFTIESIGLADGPVVEPNDALPANLLGPEPTVYTTTPGRMSFTIIDQSGYEQSAEGYAFNQAATTWTYVRAPGTSIYAPVKTGHYLVGMMRKRPMLFDYQSARENVPVAYTMVALLKPNFVKGGEPIVGVAFTNFTEGNTKVVTHCIQARDPGYLTDNPALATVFWDNSSTISATELPIRHLTIRDPNGLIWFKIDDDLTNRTFSYSYDGVTYVEVHSMASNNFVVPEYLGIFASSGHVDYPAALTIFTWDMITAYGSN